MLIRIMVRSLMNVRKLSIMSQGPNNFLNKKVKNKNKLYKIYLSRRRRRKKKTNFPKFKHGH